MKLNKNYSPEKYQPFGGIRYIPTLPPLPSEYINNIIEIKILSDTLFYLNKI